MLSVLGASSFDSVSASSLVTATLPSDPGAEAEGSVQARFNTQYVKKIVNHQVKYFGHSPRHKKQTGKLQLDSPWVYPHKSFDTVPEEDRALAQKVFVTVLEFFLLSIGMSACPYCGKNDNVRVASFDCWMCIIHLWPMHDLRIAEGNGM